MYTLQGHKIIRQISSNRFGKDEYMYYIDIDRKGDIYAVGGNVKAKEKFLATAKDSIILSIRTQLQTADLIFVSSDCKESAKVSRTFRAHTSQPSKSCHRKFPSS